MNVNILFHGMLSLSHSLQLGTNINSHSTKKTKVSNLCGYCAKIIKLISNKEEKKRAMPLFVLHFFYKKEKKNVFRTLFIMKLYNQDSNFVIFFYIVLVVLIKDMSLLVKGSSWS